jgi:Leucine-rich repeat (LRR) protein
LTLSGTQVTDAALAQLSRLPRLKTLDLNGTKVTDAGLLHLKGLTELRGLDLCGTQVTDAGLQHPKHLPKLEWLVVDEPRGQRNPKVTTAGLNDLQRALPRLVILPTMVTPLD